MARLHQCTGVVGAPQRRIAHLPSPYTRGAALAAERRGGSVGGTLSVRGRGAGPRRGAAIGDRQTQTVQRPERPERLERLERPDLAVASQRRARAGRGAAAVVSCRSRPRPYARGRTAS